MAEVKIDFHKTPALTQYDTNFPQETMPVACRGNSVVKHTLTALALLLPLAATQGAEKADAPEFDWDRIWPAASVANTLKDGRFTEANLQRLAKFPIVKLVCTRRNNDWNKLEAEARGHLKQLRPGICLLEYQNSVALESSAATFAHVARMF
jgi:hypothetical protein